MYCRKCGQYNDESAKFCSSCGAPLMTSHAGKSMPPEKEGPVKNAVRIKPLPLKEQSLKEQAPKKPRPPRSRKDPVRPEGFEKKQRKIRPWTIISSILIVVLAALLAVSTLRPFGLGNQTSQVTYEGKGASSPEEAAKTLIKGLQDQDYEEIVSAFAVETMVENYDLKGLVKRNKSYSFWDNPITFPDQSTMSKELNTQKRLNDIFNGIRRLYMTAAYPYTDVSMTIPISDYNNDAAELLADVFDGDAEILARISFNGKFISPEELVEYFDPSIDLDDLKTNLDRSKRRLIFFRGDEVKSLVADLTIDGKEYFLPMDVISYRGKWFVLNLGGTLGLYLGIAYGGVALIQKDLLSVENESDAG
jgi:hypothetical protein